MAVLLQYRVDDQLDSMLPLYRDIMERAHGLRILIYTGASVQEWQAVRGARQDRGAPAGSTAWSLLAAEWLRQRGMCYASGLKFRSSMRTHCLPYPLACIRPLDPTAPPVQATLMAWCP